MISRAQRAWRFASVLLAVLACVPLLAFSGCGGCRRGGADPLAPWGGMSKEEWLKQREARLKKEREEEARAKAAEEQAKRKAAQERQARRLKEQAKVASAAAAAAKVQRPALPEDIRQWKDEHYFAARQSNDPRLAAAVLWRGRTGIGKPEEAQFLRRLVSQAFQLGAEPGHKAVRGTSGRLAPGVLKAVADALAVNGTSEARKALEALLTGREVLGADSRPLAEAVLGALAANPSEGNRQLLVSVVCEPGRYCPPERLDLSADQLRQLAVAAVRSAADGPLRTALAQHLAGGQASAELLAAVGPLLLDSQPANAEAQAILYAANLLPAELQPKVEQYLAALAGQGLAGALGVRQASGQIGVPARTAPQAPVDAEMLETLAQRLWTPEWGRGIAIRLGSISSLGEGAALAALASTIPREEVRQRLVHALCRQWDEGPGALRSAGVGTRVIPEPGFVAVLRQARARMEPALPRTLPVRRAGSAEGRNRVPPQPATAQNPSQAWLDFEQELVRAQMAQFHEAALIQALRGRLSAPGGTLASAAFSVAFHAGATPVAVWHRAAKPEEAGSRAGLPEPLEIFYARLEGRGHPEKVVAHYRRQFAGKAELRSTSQETWLGGFRAGENRDWTSLDVLVVGPVGSDRRSAPAPVQDLTVEVLLVRAHSEQGSAPTDEKQPEEVAGR